MFFLNFVELADFDTTLDCKSICYRIFAYFYIWDFFLLATILLEISCSNFYSIKDGKRAFDEMPEKSGLDFTRSNFLTVGPPIAFCFRSWVDMVPPVVSEMNFLWLWARLRILLCFALFNATYLLNRESAAESIKTTLFLPTVFLVATSSFDFCLKMSAWVCNSEARSI